MSQLFIIKEWKHGVRGKRVGRSLRAAATINSSFLEYSGKTVRYAFNVETTRIVSHSRMHNAVPRVSHLPPLSLSLSLSFSLFLSIYLPIYLSFFYPTHLHAHLPIRWKPPPWTLPTTTLLASWPGCELTPLAYVSLLFLAWWRATSLNAVSCRLHKSRDIGLERV